MTAQPRDPDAPEIRAWANENGWDLKPHGRIPAGARSAWATANAGGAGPAEPPGGGRSNGHAGVFDFDIPDYPPDADAPADADVPPERPPEQPKRQSVRDRVSGRFTRRQPAAALPGRRRRVTLETLGGLVWGGVARLVASAADGKYAPVAACMAFQAPVAGLVAEDALKNTVADTVLQPFARLIESGSAAGALVGPPALVALVCARPELYPVARPLLEGAMKEWIVVAGPKLRELRRREEKFAAEMAEMGEEFPMGIGEMIDAIFAPMMGPPAAPEQASANGHP